MEGESSSCGRCFWPVLMVVLAFNCLLFSEVHFAWRALERLEQQKEAVAARIEQMKGQVATARTWMTILEGVCNDLLDLSKTDSDVRGVVDKYQIRRNQPIPLPDEKSDASKPAQ